MKTEMEFFTTKIVDYPVGNKINLVELNNLFSSSELPESFNDFEKIIVTLVAREPNDFEFDAWRRNGKIYLTIPLVYEYVLQEKAEEITIKCVELFKNLIKDINIEDI